MSREDRGQEVLKDADRQRGNRLGTRLLAELKRVMYVLPTADCTATQLAKRLTLDKSSCHRILTGVNQGSGEPIERLAQLPGADGMRRFVKALREAGTDEQRLVGLQAAIDLADEYVRQTFRSQAGLRRALANAVPTSNKEAAPGGIDDGIAERMHENALLLEGCESDVQFQIGLDFLNARNPAHIETIYGRGMIGFRAQARARPLALWNLYDPTDDRDAKSPPVTSVQGRPAVGRNWNCVLPEFSSHPLPIVVGGKTGFRQGVVHIIDPQSFRDGGSIDVVTAVRFVDPKHNPLLDPPHASEAWQLVNYPARHLIFDRYLHRSLMKHASIPTVGCHTWNPDFETGQSTRWLSQLSLNPTLTVLSKDLNRISDPAYPRITELTHELFDRAGLKREDFDGFRLSVRFPIWRTAYRISFDYTPIVRRQPRD
ncbi:MAG: hypothetical protein PVJ57_08245 [Phycisphaerae bacterium]|jgi:hypothetical protein